MEFTTSTTRSLFRQVTIVFLSLALLTSTGNAIAEPITIANSSEIFIAIESTSLPDLNNDGVADMGILYLDIINDKLRFQVMDGVSLDKGALITWNNIYDDPSLHLLPDLNDNNMPEIGVFGVRNDAANTGKPQLFARDLSTGQNVRVFNWPANWTSVKPIILEDITGDGLVDVAIQGRFKQGNRPQLVVRNSATSASAGTFGYPDLFNDPEFFQHSDVNGDGIAEIATFGRIKRNNKIQIKLTNGNNPSNRLKAYNFPDNWSDVRWLRLDDVNNDGVDDWALFGINKQDGRPQLIVKDGQDTKGALRLFAWSADLSFTKFFMVPDMNNDGVNEVAVGGVRSNGRYQFQVKDGVDRNTSLANHNLKLSLSDVSFHVLDDLTADRIAEIGFLGADDNGNYVLQVQNGNGIDGTVTKYNLGSLWSNRPSVKNISDINSDGLTELLVEGIHSDQTKLQIWAIPDSDNDSYPDTTDAFPTDPNEWLDTDRDTIGNNEDTDDDNDGIVDEDDAYPLVSISGFVDTDGDGIPDDCNAACVHLGMMADEDDNGDGIPDSEDIQTTLIDSQISVKLSQVGQGTITADGKTMTDCLDTRTCEHFQLNSETTEFVATPAQGWEFARWNNCTTQNDNSCSVKSRKDVALQVTFKREKTELFDNVVMLTDEQIDGLVAYNANDNQLTFSSSVDSSRFHVGKILIAQRITDSPDSSVYFAKRIIEVSRDTDNNAVLFVEQANPESIIRSGTLSSELVSTSIQQVKILNYSKYSITKSKKTSQSLDAEVFNVDITVDDNGTVDESDDITLTGYLDIKIVPSGDFDYGLTGLKEFQIVFDVAYTQSLTLAVGRSVSKKFEPDLPLFRIQLGAFPAGPLVFVPELSINTEVALDASISTALTLGLEVKTTAGIHYSKGFGISPISDFEIDPFLDFTDLLKGELSAGIALPIKASLKLYGLVGPFVSFAPYGTLVAEVALFDSCPLDVYLNFGGKASAGGEIGALGRTYSFDKDIFDFYYRYDIPGISCEFGAKDITPPSQPEITDSIVNSRVVELQWSTSIDEISSVAYTVFRGLNPVGRNINLTQFKDLVPTFGETYCYKVVARDASANEAISQKKCIDVQDSDQKPPSAPSNVELVKSTNTLELNWEASIDDSSGVSYLVFDTTNQNIEPLLLGSSENESFSYYFNRSGEYCLSVSAIDKVGNISAGSEPNCATVDSGDVNRGLVAYFPFNADFNNKSQASSNSEIFGDLELQEGISGNGAFFNGESGITVDSSTGIFDTSIFTVSAWVYSESSGRHHVMSYGEGSNDIYQYAMYQSSLGKSEGLFENDDDDDFYVYGNKLLLNNWVHIVITRSQNGDFKLYEDGTLVSEQTNTPEPAKTDDNFNIGYRNDGLGNKLNLFEGKIDELRVYRRAISAEEVTALFERIE